MGTTNLNISIDSPEVQRIALVGTPSNNIVLTSPTASSSAKVTMNTTANWATKTNYIPREGEIIVYSDRDVIDGLNYPGVKIGDGMAYVVDLPFVGDEITDRITTALNEHVNNQDIHVTQAEKVYWNNKLNCEVNNDNLILAPALF